MATTGFGLKNTHVAAAAGDLTAATMNALADDVELTRFGSYAVTHDDGANYTPGAAIDVYPVLLVGGALGAARNMVVRTQAGAWWYVYNGTTGGFALTVKTSAGTGVAIPNGKRQLIYCDGTNVVDAISHLLALLVTGTLEIDGALDHDGTTAGFFGVTPTTRPTAYTQTYATADKTHANPTSAVLTDNTGGAADTTLTTLSTLTDSPATADALRDELVTLWLPEIENNFADLAAQVNALRVDLLDLKQLANSIIDDGQALGLLQ
jgi:hypothetical protein